MRYMLEWQRSLAERFGEVRAAELAAGMHARYRALREAHRRARAHARRAQLTGPVLPGLALYRTLREDGGLAQGEALAACERLFRAAFFPLERKLLPLLNRLPDPFPLLRPALRVMSRNTYLPGAAVVVEDTPECFALNTYRCFILDALREASTPELAPLFCKTDDWLAELLPKVRWERRGTLANGADVCDFRWRRRAGSQ